MTGDSRFNREIMSLYDMRDATVWKVNAWKLQIDSTKIVDAFVSSLARVAWFSVMTEGRYDQFDIPVPSSESFHHSKFIRQSIHFL